MFVGSVIVEDQMNRQFRLDRLVDPFEKVQELLMPVPWLALADHSPFEDIQCCEQCCGSVAFVIVRLPLWQTGAQRENRLRPVQCLDLALLSTLRTIALSGGFI